MSPRVKHIVAVALAAAAGGALAIAATALISRAHAASREDDQIMAAVALKTFAWELSGTVVVVTSLTFTSSDASDAADIKLHCTSVAKSGTRLKEFDFVVYDRVPGNKTTKIDRRRVLGFSHADASGLSCNVVGGRWK